MRLIDDRLILGAVCGFLGNIPKLTLSLVAKKMHLAKSDCVDRGAGMFISTHDTNSIAARFIGLMADNSVAVILGVANIYMLSATGPQHAVLKGAIAGQCMWQSICGSLGSMGATKMRTIPVSNALIELVGHVVYGACITKLAISLGNPSLFTTKPLLAVPLSPSSAHVPPPTLSHRLPPND